MIARRVLMGLLALGVIGGYGSAARQFARHARARREALHEEVTRRAARACLDAADERRAQRDERDARDEARDEPRGPWQGYGPRYGHGSGPYGYGYGRGLGHRFGHGYGPGFGHGGWRSERGGPLEQGKRAAPAASVGEPRDEGAVAP